MINTHSATIILCCRKIIKLVYKKHARENIFVIYDRDSPIIHEDFLFYRKKVILWTFIDKWKAEMTSGMRYDGVFYFAMSAVEVEEAPT